MARYLITRSYQEIVDRLQEDPELLAMVEEAILNSSTEPPANASSTTPAKTTDEASPDPDATAAQGASKAVPDSSETPKPAKKQHSKEGYWAGLRDKPDSWWAALPKTTPGPNSKLAKAPQSEPPPSPTAVETTKDSDAPE